MPLSSLGRRQATALGRWLADQPAHLHPDAVLVSPYLRAVQTADLLLGAAGLPHLRRSIDERLRDREMGEWDGLAWSGIVARHPEEAERAELVGRYSTGRRAARHGRTSACAALAARRRDP